MIKCKNHVILFLLCLAFLGHVGTAAGAGLVSTDKEKILQLPKPSLSGGRSLEETLSGRQSVRAFSAKQLTAGEISQLLWAAQGLTRKWGGRTTPSAGALYPLEVYLAVPDGLFLYRPSEHSLLRLSDANLMQDLCSAALDQKCVREAPAVVVITAVYERTAGKYGSRAERYAMMEAGHAAQNMLLQATALGLGAVPVGAFHDGRVQKTLGLPLDHRPLYLIPVGHPK